MVESFKVVSHFPSFKKWAAFESLSQKSKNKKLFTVKKEDDVFEANKLAPMSKALESEYARLSGRNGKSLKPLYNSSSKGSLKSNSATSSRKKTLRQTVVDSRWGNHFGKHQSSRMHDESDLRDDRLAVVSDITLVSPERMVMLKRGSLKSEIDQRKFNVKDIRKTRKKRNSISINPGSMFYNVKRNSNTQSTISGSLKQTLPKETAKIGSFTK